MQNNYSQVFMRYLSRVVSALVLLVAVQVTAKTDRAESLPGLASKHGSILVYHHVSDSTPPSTSISPEKFREHLLHLKQHHQVIPLTDMVTALRSGQPLPENAVAITFDDGYRNIYDNGHPLLREFGFPYTIFVNPPKIGKQSDQLTWDLVEQMAGEGVTFANHTSDHLHLLTRGPDESEQDWLARTLADIHRAETLLQNKLGYSLKYLAYPFGEFNYALKTVLQDQGYIGFGQHSGAVSSNSDFGALPRFAAAGIYANLNTLKVKLNSLAMPVTAVAVEDPQRAHDGTLPTQTLSLDTADFNPAQINCFLNGTPLKHVWQNEQLTLTPATPLSAGRSRINCTAPSKSLGGRYYWYSQPWFVPTSDGRWLN